MSDIWHRTEDELPDDDMVVLVWLESSREIWFGFTSDGGQVWHSPDGMQMNAPKYWRDFPDPPADA